MLKELKNKFKYIVLMLFFTVEIVPDFRSSSLFWWACVAALIGVFIYDSLKNKGQVSLTLKPFETWYGVFVLYAVFSIVWAKDMSNTWDYIPSIFITCLICFAVSQMICNEKDLEGFLFARYVASVVLCIYIYLNIDLKILGDERIGVEVLGAGWNANSIALKLTIGCILGIEQIKHFKHLLLKVMVLASVVAMFSIMMFCGSRTAFIIAVCGIAVYLWISAKKKRISATFMIVAGVFGIYYLVMNVPALYNVLGYRLEILESSLAGNTQAGSGTELRLRLMRDGLQVFMSRPVFGVGMNNFRNVFGEMFGIYKYSHSNHIEVLANFGIVGTVLFYSGFIYLLIKGVRKLPGERKLNKYQILSICAVISLMLSGFGSVFYMETNGIILMTLCYSGMHISQNNSKILTDNKTNKINIKSTNGNLRK